MRNVRSVRDELVNYFTAKGLPEVAAHVRDLRTGHVVLTHFASTDKPFAPADEHLDALRSGEGRLAMRFEEWADMVADDADEILGQHSEAYGRWLDQLNAV